MILLILFGSAQASPELVSTRVWSSGFDQVGARVEVIEAPGPAAFEVAVLQGEPAGLRVYLEQEPGQPWTGPLSLRVDGLQVDFEAPSSPRSTPEATIYEAQLSGFEGGSLELLDGPRAGASLELPGPDRPWRWAWLLLVPLALTSIPLARRLLIKPA